MIVVNFGDAGEGEQGHLNGTELRESDGGCSFVYIIIYVVCWSCLPEKGLAIAYLPDPSILPDSNP